MWNVTGSWGGPCKQRSGRREELPKWETAERTSGRRLGLKIQLKEFGGNVVAIGSHRVF